MNLRELVPCSLPNNRKRPFDVVSFEPGSLVIGERLLCSNFRFTGSATLLQLAYFLFNLETLQLARSRARQVFLPDFIAPKSLCRGDLVRQTLDVKTNCFLRVHDLALPKHLEIGYD